MVKKNKRFRLVNWIKKKKTRSNYSSEAYLICKDTHRWKEKGWKMIFQASGN
jgi:hypothetical protein